MKPSRTTVHRTTRTTFALLGLAALPLALGACGDARDSSEGAAVAGVASIDPKILPITDAELGAYNFAASTPKGRTLFKYAVGWKKIQLTGANKRVFPQATMCATNLTEVYEEVFGARYRSAGVGAMLEQFRKAGSYQARFRGDSAASIVSKLNAMHAGLPSGAALKGTGYIPVGTVLAGCTVSRNCAAGGPNEHIGMIGDAKVRPGATAGTVSVTYVVWNNNWLRNLTDAQRARELGSGLGKVNDYALPKNYASLGYEREWEGVPWLQVTYDASGKALSAKRLMPELDDLDPGNAGYDTFLVVPAEIKAELQANSGVRTVQAPANARPGTAALKGGATFLKKRPVDSSLLAETEKCRIANPATVLAYADRADAEAGHVKLRLSFADASCPGFAGTVYVFGGHWTFTDK